MDVTRALESALPGVTSSTSSPDRVVDSRDLWPRRLLDARAGRPAVSPPLAVVCPTTAEELAALARFARDEGLNLVPFGAGSGVCGGVDPSPKTIVVDVKKMGDFRIDPEGGKLEVGGGGMGRRREEDVQRAG